MFRTCMGFLALMLVPLTAFAVERGDTVEIPTGYTYDNESNTVTVPNGETLDFTTFEGEYVTTFDIDTVAYLITTDRIYYGDTGSQYRVITDVINRNDLEPRGSIQVKDIGDLSDRAYLDVRTHDNHFSGYIEVKPGSIQFHEFNGLMGYVTNLEINGNTNSPDWNVAFTLHLKDGLKENYVIFDVATGKFLIDGI